MQMAGLPDTRLSDRLRFEQPMEAAWKDAQATMEAAEERFFLLVRAERGIENPAFNPLTGEVRQSCDSDLVGEETLRGTK